MQFFIIYVPSQQPKGQLQTQHSVETGNNIIGKHNIQSQRQITGKHWWKKIIIIIKLYSLSACHQRVAYNRRALKVYITKARLRLELELGYNLILGNKTTQTTR
jgi:hypothetical protein